MRSLVIVAILLLATGAAVSEEPSGPGHAAEREFRSGWTELVAPFHGDQQTRSLEARQQARLAAIPHFEAAVSDAPGNVSYQTSLAYAYLAAGKYQQAKDALDEAIERTRSDPLLYLLRAQAEAALAHMDPDNTAEKVERAIRTFDEAARLDPDNSLALIQAASVAFDAGRIDIALNRLEEGLKRPAMTLYRLGIPGDLGPDLTTSLKLWQYAQMEHWMDLLIRGQNVVRNVIKLGAAKEREGDWAAASATFNQALEVSCQIGNARPNTFIAVNAGINAMEDSYAGLARVAEATGSREVEKWRGYMGVLNIGRQQLYADLQTYMQRLENDPPASVEELLELQAESLSFTMRGVALSPVEKTGPPRRPKKDAPSEG